MSAQSKREYMQAIYQRYRLAARPEKGHILDEFCQVTRSHRKHAIRLLNGLARYVKRRRDGTMIRRWIGLGVLRAATRCRRIQGHDDLAALATALRPAAAGARAA